jgi:hypothetical protein
MISARRIILEGRVQGLGGSPGDRAAGDAVGIERLGSQSK